MKVLFFGDIFGKPGRDTLKKAIQKHLPLLKPDFIIVNGENASHGRGILPENAQEFLDWGVDGITLGNHAWDQKQIIPFMGTCPQIIRPANYPNHSGFPTPGRGMTVLESRRTPGLRLGLLQVMGRVFMDDLDCPFLAADREINRLENVGVECIFVDFHGEASSEKQAFSYYVDGRVSAVIGTHSHVQTADERILPGGTAALTDVGMTGCFDSVIGVKKELSIQKFITKRPLKYEPAEGPGGYGCVLIEINHNTGKAVEIKRFREPIL